MRKLKSNLIEPPTAAQAAISALIAELERMAA
jgi:hypothetical protein